MLEINHLTKRFKDNMVLKDVSFSVNDGEIVCLLGNNGAGKTTIINCILKMMKPDSGSITFNGKNITAIRNRLYFSKISALLESSCNVYDYLSGWQNITYFAGLMNLHESYKEKARRYITDFEMDASIDEPVGNYSRGMQQKLALIIALLSSPEVLLLDEPTLGLDIKSKLSVISILNRIVAQEKICVILTTHQMDVVQKLNCRILLLKGGRIHPFETKDHDSLNVYEVSFLENGTVKQVTEEGDFGHIYSRYSPLDLIEIKRSERDIDDMILEALDESD